MSIQYRISIDHNDDGDFSGGGETITPQVLSMRWRLGMAQPFAAMAQPTEAQITVRNAGRGFSPEISGMQPGKRIRIQSDDGVTTRTHFSGFIQRIDPAAGDQGQRTAVITAYGAEERLPENRVSLQPMEHVTADVGIGKVLDQTLLRHTVLAGVFILGIQSTLGTHTLAGHHLPRQFETGQSVLTRLGDQWGDAIPADEAIRQIVESERGRFYVNREGTAVFLNRHHTLLNHNIKAVFSDDMAGLHYSYAANIRNRVQVTVTPRGIGEADTVLWQLENRQRIPAGGRQRIAIRYHDANGNPVSARGVKAVYSASTSSTGGESAAASISVVLDYSGADRASLSISNNSSRDVFLEELTLRGTPISGGNPMMLEYSDHTSITNYGLHTLSLDLPALSSLDEADAIARYELARRKLPAGMLTTLSTNSRAHPAETLELTLFDRITVHESQTGHSSDAFIVAEDHQVSAGGAAHQVTWTLEPADDTRFAVLGTMRLDGPQVLAY